jgi:hypothetical protein
MLLLSSLLFPPLAVACLQQPMSLDSSVPAIRLVVPPWAAVDPHLRLADIDLANPGIH